MFYLFIKSNNNPKRSRISKNKGGIVYFHSRDKHIERRAYAIEPHLECNSKGIDKTNASYNDVDQGWRTFIDLRAKLNKKK